MGEELKISAYALSSTGKELNLDNMFVNGRFVSVGSDSKSVINKVSHADFQIYGVCDSEIGVADDRNLGMTNSAAVMQMMQRLQTSLQDVGKIEKDRIWDAMVETNRSMKRMKNDAGRDEMGSSFASLFLHGNRGLAVHLGDSRIYVVRGGRMLQITDDHLESSDMYRLGVISQAQAEVHKRSSNLIAYLGMDDIYDAKDEAFSKYFVFYPGDTFIICTDGLSDAISNEEMERMVRLLKDASIDTLANMMMKAAADHTDADMTIMILRVEDAPGEAPKRGTSTIPRKENFEKNAMPADDMNSAATTRLPKVSKAIRKTEPEDDMPEGPAAEPRRTSRPMQPLNEDPNLDQYDEEEEGSLLDNLLSNPKRLIMLAGGAIAVILLLVIIIFAFSGSDDSDTQSSANSVAAESSTITSSMVLPGANSSTALDSSSVTDDSNTSDTSDTSDSDSSATVDDSSSTDSTSTDTIQEYTVVDGDYFYSIVLYFYDSGDLELMEAFAAYNDMTLDSELYPGMVLKIPPVEDLVQ